MYRMSAICSLRENCPNTGKYGPETIPYSKTFHAVAVQPDPHLSQNNYKLDRLMKCCFHSVLIHLIGK